ncbi:MAG: penicillin-binding protein 2 [Hyphomonadaceae bacterium]|nr:penicillin-binding protein 2 [Hyphomonadaceae bacterium]
MRPLGPSSVFSHERLPQAPLEAAPARNRVRFLAISIFAILLLLAGRAVQLAFSGDPLSRSRSVSASMALPRADIVDRNGVLLATTVRAWALTADPAHVRNAVETADILMQHFPGLQREALLRRLSNTDQTTVYLDRGLTEEQRDRAIALRLPGIGAEPEHHRDYPQGALAAHVIGFSGIDLNPQAGVELGLDEQIRAAGAEGRPVRLSIDVRMQYALETELDAAARASHATGGSAILLDGRTGETLALASWPTFDPNHIGRSSDNARRDRVSGDVHEMGSTIKPFTVAMALQENLVQSSELFDLSRPLDVDNTFIADHEPIAGYATLRDILAHSSNVGAARLALRVGGARQRAYLERLGLTSPTTLQLGRRQTPIAPAAQSRRDVAGLGFGYGLATTQATLASAYTVFTNNGARVAPTILALAPDAAVERTQIFTPAVTRQVMLYLRAVVTEGTGRAANVPGLLVAGKTGTAEKLGNAQGYDESRNFSSFVGVFPANDPRYVIVVALDDTGAGEAGGLVAAPVVARTLRRIAPMLGLRVEPAPAAR